MFEHLDDHDPGRIGTGAQLAAVRNRARVITRDRRRSQLAVGSVTLTAAASVSGVAVLTGAGPLHHLDSQAGTGRSGATLAPPAKTVPSSSVGRKGPAGVPESSVNPDKVGPASGAASKEPCAASSGPAASKAPDGYTSTATTSVKPEGHHYVRSDGQDATVWVKVTCAGIGPDDRTSTSTTTYTQRQVAGFDGWSWHSGSDEAGVEWTATDGTSVYIKAVGAPGLRLSDAALETFAESLPAT